MADPACPRCGGSGFVVTEREDLSGADRCDCTLRDRLSRVEERSGIPKLYRTASLENFSTQRDNPSEQRDLKRLLLEVSSYVRDFRYSDSLGLLLIGDSGTGKTHLAIAALRALFAKGFEGLFLDCPAWLERIRAGHAPGAGESAYGPVREAMEAEILLLDDIGAPRMTEFVEDTMNTLIGHRCNNKKVLIATTNLPDADAGDAVVQRMPGSSHVDYRQSLAERIGTRARSRLFEMCRIVRMPAVEDYRVRKGR